MKDQTLSLHITSRSPTLGGGSILFVGIWMQMAIPLIIPREGAPRGPCCPFTVKLNSMRDAITTFFINITFRFEGHRILSALRQNRFI
tara:strand:+ start:203 stop:466 length:264 start_codon:yes stop_codon:yes gene_type:complete